MLKNIFYKILGFWALLFVFVSCEKTVEDGYRTEYEESPAQLTVAINGNSSGAINDTIVFVIHAKSAVDIRAINVTSSISGSGGSGYKIPSGNTDPLIDHSYGTIQKNTKEFNLLYNYIITQDTADPVVTFKLIDLEGQKTVKQTVVTLPGIVRYGNVSLFTMSNDRADGFSTADSVKYRDMSKYASETAVNKTVQKSVDMVFIVESDQAWLVAPYDGRFWAPETFIKNKTRFLTLTNVTSDAFNKMNSAQLSAVIKSNAVKQNGTTSLAVKKGDIVGFFTDYGSLNSYKAGILRVNTIHPSYCTWYSGTTYQIDMDIITQISK